ncbi:O-antigen/teichoic acid export membrane protein [Sinorhizobium fredii]
MMSLSQPQSRARIPSLRLQVRRVLPAVVRSPLIWNGYALIASAGLTSVLGLAFWGLAARLYTPEQVGLGAALISTMLTLGNISQLNLGNFLNRYLPPAGRNALRLVLAAYAVAGAAAALLSALVVFVIPHFVTELSFLRDEPLSMAAFVVATVAWTLFALQDSVLAGLRRATVVPVENAIFSIAKLLLLALFSGSSLLGSGLYAVWVLPLPLLLALINWLIFVRFLPQHRSGAESSGPDRHALLRYFGWDYAGTLASMAAMGVAPLIVLHYGGPGELAVYYISWEVAYGLYLVSRSMGISLLAEAAFERGRLHQLAVDALIYATAPLLAGVTVLLLGAPLLLSLLGAQYAGASSTLPRLLALSCLPWSLVTLMLAAARATGRTEVVATAQVATLAILLGLGTPLVIAAGAVGMAAAWLVAHCCVAVGLLADLSLRLGPTGRLELCLRLLSSLVRHWRSIAPFERSSASLEVAIARFCAATRLGNVDPRTIREFRRESDVRTGLFKASKFDGGDLIFKSSRSAGGRRALVRHILRAQALRAEALLDDLGFEFSKIVACHVATSEVSLAEHAWPGEDGRAVLSSGGLHFPALTCAVAGIAEIHTRTAMTKTIDGQWLQRWVDGGVEAARKVPCCLLDDKARAGGLARFLKEQRQFWAGRRLPLGLGHGDFSPGNLLFAVGPGDSDARLVAIIDWEAASCDAPPGIDAMFMLLTARALRSGEELGFVVRQMLQNPALTRQEELSMASLRAVIEASYGSLRHRAVIRALCGLAWWRHVSANLSKSSSFADKPLWVSINVDLVLACYNQDSETVGGLLSAVTTGLKRLKMHASRAKAALPQ